MVVTDQASVLMGWDGRDRPGLRVDGLQVILCGRQFSGELIDSSRW